MSRTEFLLLLTTVLFVVVVASLVVVESLLWETGVFVEVEFVAVVVEEEDSLV